jgi:hypothetical protein
MVIEPEKVQRFYQVWFPLLHYINEQRHLIPNFPSKWGKRSVPPADAAVLRDALWQDDSLREAFIAENPAHLSPDDLALIASWKHRVAGDFFVFRYLRKYSVFLSAESPAHAYGVLGLVSSIEEIVGPYLPICVKAVLLPFEGRIIYDSLLAPYPVYFGGGIRRDLADTYRHIQEREGIITLLPSNPKSGASKNVSAGNKKILSAFQKDLGQAGLSPKMIEQHTANMGAFAQDYLSKQKPPQSLLDLTLEDVAAYIGRKNVNVVSLKRFVQFLRDTARMDYQQAQEMLDFLKQNRK